ncbi:twin-arginine translocation signal domain-containing protein [Noviherbaspirillum cavernae]|uniref:Twin-arginine translocation signal domain-containing protein n=1 Tax=Noviherbaspirillum cavernae TaxID=2320862 RepID=A0A418WZM2_9BURK|nr:TRAP transporter substrate-binding protein [Noviherbaspirillum cavernae]RJG05641.1 twin-arginine translocation signal domain-containing protein [Noviherbaspirillum cavernae]
MERRSFLKKAAVGASVGAIAAPALAQSLPTINWRLASSFPKSLDTIYGAAETFSKRVSQLTNGKFNIRVFAGGEIVPALQVMDAVQAGTVEMGHSASYYYYGKDPSFAFDGVVPFGLNSRQQTAWFDQGGGQALMREFFKDYGIVNFMGGNTGAQMGGWFRKEVKTVKDLDGLKMRIGGFAGRVLQRLGSVPQQIAGGDIYPALEKGTIDAAEWIGPYDDEKLGFNKVAPFYYAPGWWEPGLQLSFYIGVKEWEKLPKEYQYAVEAASYEAHVVMQAEYDARNPAALARLLKNGVKLRSFSREIMEACYKATNEVMEEESAKNAKFKKIYEPWKRFRQDQNQWFSVSELPMQNFMINHK